MFLRYRPDQAFCSQIRSTVCTVLPVYCMNLTACTCSIHSHGFICHVLDITLDMFQTVHRTNYSCNPPSQNKPNLKAAFASNKTALASDKPEHAAVKPRCQRNLPASKLKTTCQTTTKYEPAQAKRGTWGPEVKIELFIPPGGEFCTQSLKRNRTQKYSGTAER